MRSGDSLVPAQMCIRDRVRMSKPCTAAIFLLLFFTAKTTINTIIAAKTKRGGIRLFISLLLTVCMPVSYTHLDVYKRQPPQPVKGLLSTGNIVPITIPCSAEYILSLFWNGTYAIAGTGSLGSCLLYTSMCWKALRKQKETSIAHSVS